MGIAYGSKYTDVLGTGDGSSAGNAAPTARAIKKLTGTNTDGVYWINLPTVGPTQVYCIMNNAWDGGGWMMAMKATRGTTFQYSSNYWTTANTLNPTDLTLNDADAKYNTMNYFLATDIAARFPDTSAGGTLGSGLGGWTWNENGFAPDSRTTLIDFFSRVSDYYKLQDSAVTSWVGHVNGPFSAQAGYRRYGFNIVTGGREARWGFSWNNETTPGSNDVDSGIGMGNRVFYSCGDYITCCQTYSGVNRSMRVELWVR
jgi:hypothetical protein